MTKKEKQKQIANKLALNIELEPNTKTLFTKDGSDAKKHEEYAELFGFDCRDFEEVYKISTGGPGNESKKINTIYSSSLLPLLVFFKLYDNKNKQISITCELPNSDLAADKEKVVFDQCFFEVRNKVITIPSCVDVVLYSSEKKILLFLESKFTEYIERNTIKTCGKSYVKLYRAKAIEDALKNYIEIGKNEDKIKLTSKTGCYIEGIKQSISHLIGLVRGPQQGGIGHYPDKYYKKYEKAFSEAETLYFGTILFNPAGLGVDAPEFNDYCELYKETIGANGAKIVNAIKEWCKNINKNDRGKNIKVLCNPISYQDLFKDEDNMKILTEKVQLFYALGNKE